MEFMKHLKETLSAPSGILSSKRVCGVIGWLVIIGIMIYCAISGSQAPLMIDTFMLCCMGLLGIDSVTGIWKKNADTI